MSDAIIAARLRELRDKTGASQDEVAEKCEISRVTLARYENGTRTPVLKNASKLAAYYGVDTDYLMGKKDAENPISEEHEKLFRMYDRLSSNDQEAILNQMQFLWEYKNRKKS
nr:MAG TPA: Repressor protein CI [Caudoviricetes sp.]